MQAALTQAAVAPQAVGWLNLHGTGTPQNDQMEALAVATVLPQVACTSTKPLTGHTLAAAGRAGSGAMLAGRLAARQP